MDPSSQGINYGGIDPNYQRSGPSSPSGLDSLLGMLQGLGSQFQNDKPLGWLWGHSPFVNPGMIKQLLGKNTNSNGIVSQGNNDPLGISNLLNQHNAGPPGGYDPTGDIYNMLQGQEQGLSPIQQALAQLDQLTNQKTPGTSEADLNQALAEAAAGINKQYGSEIGAIRHTMGGARKDTRSGSKEVQAMYKALAQSYRQAGNRESRQGNQLAQQLQNMGENSQQAITNQAMQMNQQSVNAAKALGLGKLGQALINRTNQTAQNLSGSAGARGDMAGETVLGQAGNNRTFMNTSGQTSRLEGTNKAADMYAQLQDYLDLSRSKIGDIAGQRQQALAGSEADIKNTFATASSDAQQQMIDNKLALLQLAMNAQNNQQDYSLAQQKLAQGGGTQQDYYGMLPDQVGGPAQLLANRSYQ